MTTQTDIREAVDELAESLQALIARMDFQPSDAIFLKAVYADLDWLDQLTKEQ